MVSRQKAARKGRKMKEHTDVVLVLAVTAALLLLVAVLAVYCSRNKKDSLTGALSMDGFYRYAARLASKGALGAVVQMDLLRFCMINERFGMGYGDALLKDIMECLRRELPGGIPIARMHSDIFCLYLPEKKRGEISDIIERLAGCIGDLPDVAIRPCFGISMLSGAESIEEAAGRAGIALKFAKRHPAVPVCFFYTEMLDELRHYSEMEGDMRNAIKERQFQVYLQPKYDVMSSRIVGAEALARWRHPEKGLIGPEEFIPLFEENGFICEFDRYMWEQAASVIREWMAKDIPVVPISVNISRAQKMDGRLCVILEGIVSESHIAPENLQLEFTERSFGEGKKELYDAIYRLRKMGFTILMDDFGSGYSSLNMLKDCPVDIVKLDKGFLRCLDEGGHSRRDTVIGHVVRLLHDLGLGIVAEGVENEEQKRLLEKSGCRIAQGYYYSPPVTVEKFNEMYLEDAPSQSVS